MDPFSDGGTGRRRRSGGRSGGCSDARAKLLLAVVAAGAITLVLVLIATTGGGSDETASGPPGTAESQPESGRAGTAGENGDGAGGEPVGTRDSREPPGESAPDDAPEGGAGDGSAGAGPIPERAQDPDVAPEPGEEIQKSHDDGEQAYVEAPEGGPEPGREWESNQPEGGYDPLGRDADPSGLAGPEKERVRFAAANYVTYGYGYAGDDLSEYHGELFDTMVEGRFQDSPGRADIKAVEDDIKDGGTNSAAVLDRFEVQQADGDEVQGVAYFTLGESYDGGGVSGNTASLAQPLNLERMSGGWQVVAADRLEEVSGG